MNLALKHVQNLGRREKLIYSTLGNKLRDAQVVLRRDQRLLPVEFFCKEVERGDIREVNRS